MDKNCIYFKFNYFIQNWKMILHLLFATHHFGVNNDAWFQSQSLFGKPFSFLFPKIITNYRMMRLRAFSGFIPLDDAIKLFPEYAKQHQYKHIE